MPVNQKLPVPIIEVELADGSKSSTFGKSTNVDLTKYEGKNQYSRLLENLGTSEEASQNAADRGYILGGL